jgi:hypothetical protein
LSVAGTIVHPEEEMDQEALSRLGSEVARLRTSADGIAARIRALGDIEVVIDEDGFRALEFETAPAEEQFSQWMIRL